MAYNLDMNKYYALIQLGMNRSTARALSDATSPIGAGSTGPTAVISNTLASLTGVTQETGSWTASGGVSAFASNSTSGNLLMGSGGFSGVARFEFQTTSSGASNARVGILLDYLSGDKTGSCYLYVQRTGTNLWKAQMDAYASSAGNGSSSFSLTDSGWHTLAAEYSWPNYRLFVDGTLRLDGTYNRRNLQDPKVGLEVQNNATQVRNFRRLSPFDSTTIS